MLMITNTPCGMTDSTKRVLSDVVFYTTYDTCGLALSPSAALAHLSNAALRLATVEHGTYFYHDTKLDIVLFDSQMIRECYNREIMHSMSMLPQALVERLSLNHGSYLQAVGITPESSRFAIYQAKNQQARLRKARSGDLIVTAWGDWKTCQRGTTMVATADGSCHYVSKDSYASIQADEIKKHCPLLSDCKIVELAPLKERICSWLQSRIKSQFCRQTTPECAWLAYAEVIRENAQTNSDFEFAKSLFFQLCQEDRAT